jgi:type 1 fimbria pilin
MKKLKLILALLLGLAFVGTTLTALADDDDKKVTITGNMVCAKCTLHVADKCQNVVQVMDGTNTVNYFIAKGGDGMKMHDDICHGDSKKVTATGTVEDEGGKKVMTVTKLAEAK